LPFSSLVPLLVFSSYNKSKGRVPSSYTHPLSPSQWPLALLLGLWCLSFPFPLLHHRYVGLNCASELLFFFAESDFSPRGMRAYTRERRGGPMSFSSYSADFLAVFFFFFAFTPQIFNPPPSPTPNHLESRDQSLARFFFSFFLSFSELSTYS